MKVRLINVLSRGKTRQVRLLLIAGAVVLALSVIAPPATASSGTLVITADTTLSEDHQGNLVIAADDITLDCAGHTITGPGDGVGIDFSDRSHVTIKNCLVTNFFRGFYAATSTAINLVDNSGNANTEYGFLLESSDDTTLRGNTADSNEYVGIQISGYRNRVEENTTNSNGFGLVSGGFFGTVRNNTAIGNSGNGFELAAEHTTLTGNVARENPGVGFLTWFGSSNNLLMNNTAEANAEGFIVTGSSLGNELRNNTSTKNLNTGFWIQDGSTGTVLRNNTSSSNYWGIVFYDTTESTVENNTLSSNTFVGLHLYHSDHNSVISNQVTRNDWGIVSDGNDNYLSGNQVKHSTEYGIVLGEETGNVLENNNVIQNGATGFAVLGSNNTLTDNIANQNGAAGFLLFEGSTGNTLTKNTSMTNALGFLAEEGAIGNTFTGNVAQANSDWDAQDDNGLGANTWLNNQFGTTNGL